MLGNGKLCAVREGKKIWEYPVSGNLTIPQITGPDGTVYAGSSGSMMFAIKDGKKVWEFPCKLEAQPCIGPDGTIYAGEYGGMLYAIKDGKELWRYSMGGGFLTPPAMTPGGTIVVRSDSGKLYALASTGDTMRERIKEKLSGMESGNGAGQAIVETDEWLILDGIKLPRNMAYIPGQHLNR
jgi:hypothetical protein